VLHDDGRHEPGLAGTPHGGVISPLLANIYLNGLDHALHAQGFDMICYADDCVIRCPTAAAAQAAFIVVRQWTAAHRLSLHPEKTSIVDLTHQGASIDFLGFTRKRWTSGRTGIRSLLRLPRSTGVQKLRNRIRAETRRCKGHRLSVIIERINPNRDPMGRRATAKKQNLKCNANLAGKDYGCEWIQRICHHTPAMHPAERFTAPASIETGTPLKLLLNRRAVALIAESFVDAVPGFARSTFVRQASAGLDDLELKPRAAHIAHVLATHLSSDPATAAQQLIASLGPELSMSAGNGLKPFFICRTVPSFIPISAIGTQAWPPTRPSPAASVRNFLSVPF